MYPLELIRLQIDFAKRASQLENIVFSLGLLKYSPIARFLKIKYSEMNVENPTWKNLIELLSKSTDSLEQAKLVKEYKEWLGISYQEDFDVSGNPKAEFGCFSFDYNPEKKQVQVHFSNNHKGENGPLSKENMPERSAELTSMFAFIKSKHPEAETVRGHSWLYSIEAYRRLFPPEYIASGTIKQTFLNTSMWGQFIDSEGNFKEVLGTKFNECFISKSSIEEMTQCFPHQQPKVMSDINVFYKFYNIS